MLPFQSGERLNSRQTPPFALVLGFWGGTYHKLSFQDFSEPEEESALLVCEESPSVSNGHILFGNCFKKAFYSKTLSNTLSEVKLWKRLGKTCLEKNDKFWRDFASLLSKRIFKLLALLLDGIHNILLASEYMKDNSRSWSLATACSQVATLNGIQLLKLEPNIEYAFPLFLQPSKIIPVQNGLEVKRTQRSYGSEEAAVSRKTKRLHRIARDENENTSSGSKKCKKISATALNDTNEHIEDIRRFARAFKMKRLSLGLTQTQIGRALTAGDGPAYSQSAICRFEKLDITPKSAQRIKPVLERWLAELEGRRPNDQMASHPTNLGNKNSVCGSVGSSPEDSGIYRADCESDESCAGIRKRKSRTNFSADALERLNHEFNINMHPSGSILLTPCGKYKKAKLIKND
ncbi:POU domain-containing transcription factor [Echinococcus granulosus]|uniref:POU domain-containing transcription factor n=1 Tax=Echinococcus granulosus TaxID=6210 RepID=W6URA9_ECHGR|nr:POU domain-containing transcription factor [Echinococcus granulosus]EUB63221.1 POU domain-containing transcription factor [Echinococcus granulosus]